MNGYPTNWIPFSIEAETPEGMSLELATLLTDRQAAELLNRLRCELGDEIAGIRATTDGHTVFSLAA